MVTRPNRLQQSRQCRARRAAKIDRPWLLVGLSFVRGDHPLRSPHLAIPPDSSVLLPVRRGHQQGRIPHLIGTVSYYS